MQTRATVPNQGDADVASAPRYLPAGPNTTVHFSPIEVGKVSAFGELPHNFAAVVDIPALDATQLPDGSTLTVTILSSDEIASPPLPAPEVPTILAPGTETVLGTLVITGANGNGAPAQSLRVELWIQPNKGYVGATMVSNGATGDLSAAWGQFRVVA
jgi:hypothetical protein